MAASDSSNDEASAPMLVPNPPSHFSIETDLANELLKLSFKDRVAIQEEIHGVRCLAVEETPQLLESALLEFDKKLMQKKLEDELQERQVQHQQKRHQDVIVENNSTTTNNNYRKRNLLRNIQSISNLHHHQQQHKMKLSASTSMPFSPLHSSGQEQQIPLQQFNTTTSGSSNNNKSCCYLNDPNVRLRFLRAECFDVQKAVQRFVSFLELTSELFGDYVAERPIQISDFSNRKEEVALQNSRNQYLPFRDRSGRRVFVGVGHCDFDLTPPLRYKIMTYLHWIASEDLETQQKGVVIVAWPTEEGGKDVKNEEFSWEKSIRPKMDMRLRKYQQKLAEGMPLRVTSQQAYFKDTPFFRAMSVLYYIGMDSQSRSMYKAHYGEPTELRYALSGYGIPEHLLPISHTGTVKTANHSRWINALRAKEQRQKGSLNKNNNNINNVVFTNNATTNFGDKEEDIVDCPGSRDVIFRKGPTYKNNPGNMYFRELIEATHDQHAKGSRKEKCKITWEIVNEIEAQKGRFLDWSSPREMWIVAKDREKIRKKVAACYKQYNRSVATFQNYQQEQQQQQKMRQPQPQQQQQEEDQKISVPMAKASQSQNHEQQQQQQMEARGESNEMDIRAVHDEASDVVNTFQSKKLDRRLREYYDTIPLTKRRKTFSPFCGGGDYSSSSDSSDCGFGLAP